MPVDPYDTICAPRYINFLSKSWTEDDGETSKYFETDIPEPPFRPAPTSSSTPQSGGNPSFLMDMDVSDAEDKTIIPEDEDANRSDKILCSALSRINLSNTREKLTILAGSDSPELAQGSSSCKSTDKLKNNLVQVNTMQEANFVSKYNYKVIKKRSRSPVPSNLPDYSLPPEKYIGVSRCSVPFPKENQTLPLKDSVLSSTRSGTTHLAVNIKSTGRARISTQATKTLSTHDIRIGCRPKPKVPIFQKTEYQRKPVKSTSSINEFTAGNKSSSSQKYSLKKVSTSKLNGNENIILGSNSGLVHQKIPNKLDLVHYNAETKENHSTIKETAGVTTVMNNVGKSIFYAQPQIWRQKPFLPKKSVREPTRPLNFKLHTEQRALKREQFDRLITEKMIHQDLMAREKAEEQQKKQTAEIAQMRKALAFKARPAPQLPPFEIKKSNKILTEPVTPTCFHQK